MTTEAYISSVEPVEYFGLHSGRIGSGFRGTVVRASNNTVAWRSRIYNDKRAALLQANRMKPRYQYHLDKHGVGFEEQQEEERAAKKAARKVRRAFIDRLNSNAEDMLAAAKAILAENTPESRQTLRDLIEKIEG